MKKTGIAQSVSNPMFPQIRLLVLTELKLGSHNHERGQGQRLENLVERYRLNIYQTQP